MTKALCRTLTNEEGKSSMHPKLNGSVKGVKKALRKLTPFSTSRDYEDYFESLDIEGKESLTHLLAFGEEPWYYINDTRIEESIFRIIRFAFKEDKPFLAAREEDASSDEFQYISEDFIKAFPDFLESVATSAMSSLSAGQIVSILKAMGVKQQDLDLSIQRERLFHVAFTIVDGDGSLLIRQEKELMGERYTVDMKVDDVRYGSAENMAAVCTGYVDLGGHYMPVKSAVNFDASLEFLSSADVGVKPLYPTAGETLVKEVKGRVVTSDKNPLKPGGQETKGPRGMMAMMFGGGDSKSNTSRYDAHERIIVDGEFLRKNAMGIVEALFDDTFKKGNMTSLPGDTISVLTDVQKCVILPITFGFAVKTKALVMIDNNHVSDPVWIENIRDSLVIEPNLENLMWALLQTPSVDTDVISGKGNNTSILMIGKPGLGKTLVAEVMSERDHKPLLKLSIADISTNLEEVEKNLVMYTGAAARWGIPLLIDEADVLIEERDINNLQRNGVVATVLQILEYHQGTLFLTSNRVESIDPAIRSRITLTAEFNHCDIVAICRSIFKRIGIGEDEIAKLDQTYHADRLKELVPNGRELKNLINVTLRLCAYNGETFSVEAMFKTAGSLSPSDKPASSNVPPAPTAPELTRAEYC